MKHYQIVLEVPDNFNPEELDMTVSYQDDIEIFSEGFTNDDELSEKLKSIIESCEISTIEVKDNDVVLFKFDDSVQPEEASIAMLTIEEKTGRPALGVNKDIDLLVEDADSTIEMLNGMIAKVKTRAAVKDTSSIVLPS